MAIPRKTFRMLILAVVFAAAGACIDFYFEWPVKIPGDPPTSLYTLRHAVGVSRGWISYSTDDIFAYDDLTAGFSFSIHTPIVREPFGSGGWMDFGVFGIAPWFIAACIMLFRFLRASCRALRRRRIVDLRVRG
jgi:hypothetical protein